MDNRRNIDNGSEYTIVKLPDGRIVNMNLREFKNTMDNGDNQRAETYDTTYNQEMK